MYNRPFRSHRPMHGRSVRGRTTKIDPSRYVKKAIGEEAQSFKPVHESFDAFSIADLLKKAIKDKGYVSPTQIQDAAIIPILQGRDVIGLANTGTGKTAAFLVPLIHKVFSNRTQKVLIIVPTRELAVQIFDESKALSKDMRIVSVLCIGGVSMQRQIQNLRFDHDIVIVTPGRAKDLERHRKLNFQLYNTIVLDEVDRMMDMGFITDIRYIISRLPEKRQSLFFSATLPDSLKSLTHSFLKNPITISVRMHETAKNVEQDVIRMRGRQRVDILTELLLQEKFEKVLVFGRTKWGMDKLARILEERGHKVAAIHGNKRQSQRQFALNAFKNGSIRVLLATDVASRGIDIENVTHVINYDEPASYEDYIHRVGRTGRANKMGIALTFID